MSWYICLTAKISSLIRSFSLFSFVREQDLQEWYSQVSLGASKKVKEGNSLIKWGTVVRIASYWPEWHISLLYICLICQWILVHHSRSETQSVSWAELCPVRLLDLLPVLLLHKTSQTGRAGTHQHSVSRSLTSLWTISGNKEKLFQRVLSSCPFKTLQIDSVDPELKRTEETKVQSAIVVSSAQVESLTRLEVYIQSCQRI